ncbi:MAG: hypothetical protein ACLT33_06205 [Lachnospira pectinoschiza]
MDSLNVVTLPITEGRKLQALFRLMTLPNRILKHLITEYCRMLRQVLLILLNTWGRVITGDESEIFDKGKMLVAAANPDMMESMIDEGDIVILVTDTNHSSVQ